MKKNKKAPAEPVVQYADFKLAIDTIDAHTLALSAIIKDINEVAVADLKLFSGETVEKIKTAAKQTKGFEIRLQELGKARAVRPDLDS